MNQKALRRSKISFSAPSDPVLSKAHLQVIADQFKVLSQPLRLQLLHELRRGEKTVTDLMAMTGARQANVSKHLAMLAASGLLSRRKAGLQVYYFIRDPSVLTLCDIVCAKLQHDYQQRADAFATPRSKTPR